MNNRKLFLASLERLIALADNGNLNLEDIKHINRIKNYVRAKKDKPLSAYQMNREVHNCKDRGITI